MKKRKVVTIGGGTGQFALLSGLRDLEGVEITAVVSMADSGGSTGRLRDELGILPPGDVLKCILALSPYHSMARTILLKRFTSDIKLKGHNAGNLLLTMLSDYAGSFPAGIQALVEILNVRGKILPVTIDKATLVAELSDGERIYGQAAINVPQGARRERFRTFSWFPTTRVSFRSILRSLKPSAAQNTLLSGRATFSQALFPTSSCRASEKRLRRDESKDSLRREHHDKVRRDRSFYRV
jgi:2-phospho-L-lactate transferase/gluconeogenesis factor (CofD/UPF0052 family)